MKDFKQPDGIIRKKRIEPAKKTKGKGSDRPEPKRLFSGISLLFRRIISLLALGTVIFAFTALPSSLNRPIDPSRIRIYGNSVLPQAHILRILNIDRTSWLKFDAFEFSVLLNQHPWVSQSIVHRRNDFGLDIVIKERKPIAYLKTGSNLFLMGKDFRVLSFVKSGKIWDLPVIIDENLTSLEAGDYVSKDQFVKAFSLISLLKRNDTLPLSSISEIHITDPLNYELVTIPDGIVLKLGSNNFEKKIKNLHDASPVLADYKDNIRYIDLRYNDGLVLSRKI